MATEKGIRDVGRRFAMKPADVTALADRLFAAKRRVYRRSLLELARSLGYTIKRPTLSEAIERELRAEADRSARQIAETHNRDLARALPELAEGATNADLAAKVKTWQIARQRKRANPTAVTEVYPAHTDALVSAVRDLGFADDTLWDFGGHPELGDADPECAVCETLERLSPWTTEQVRAIGNPHPNCRQDWHVRSGIDVRLLPTDPQLGQQPGGVLGEQPLVIRTGDHASAVDFLIALRNE